jgi:hypothetical protein
MLLLHAFAIAVYPGNFALTFSAPSGSVLRVPHESSMAGPLIDSFTVEFWLLARPHDQLYPEEGRVVNLVGFPGRHPFVGLASDTGCAVVQLKLSDGSWYTYEGTHPIADGEWHHVAATWDGTKPQPEQRELALYVDGELQPSGSDEDDAPSQTPPMRPEAAQGQSVVRSCADGLCEEGMHVGGLYCCSGGGYTGRYFNGTLDELRVWTRARTRTEILSTLATPLAAGDEPSLLFYFPLDEAGMEVGANVVESRALPWYGILGNAAGGGRPSWTISTAPLSCTRGSRAPVCVRLAGGDGSGGEKEDGYYGDDRPSHHGEDGEGSMSLSAVFLLVVAVALFSGTFAAIATYTSIKGDMPPLFSETLQRLTASIFGNDYTLASRRGAAGSSGAGSASHRSKAVPPAVSSGDEWRWATPPRPDQQPPPGNRAPQACAQPQAVTSATPTDVPGRPSSSSYSYGGL